jgi:hypothetical protein
MIIWKDIPGYEGEYQASKCGRIKSIDRVIVTKNGQLRKYKGSERKPQKHSSGYLAINLRQSDQHLWHRLIALTHHEKAADKSFVNHKDGNKLNNHSDNLEWSTRQENETHAYSTGLKNSTGSNNTMAKLNEKKVIEIRSLISDGIDKAIVAKQFNVHKGTIDRVVSRRIWTHV